MGLNKYGELIEDNNPIKELFKIINNPSPKISCATCGNPIYSNECLICNICGNNHAYCNNHCIETHQKTKHYHTKFCASCAMNINNKYYYNYKINIAFNREYRFCSMGCCTTFRNITLCQECDKKIPKRRKWFCSNYCKMKYQRERPISLKKIKLGQYNDTESVMVTLPPSIKIGKYDYILKRYL